MILFCTTSIALALAVLGFSVVAAKADGGSTAPGVTSFSATCPTTGPSTGAVTLSNFLQLLVKTGNYTGLASDCGAAIRFTITSAATYTPPTPASVGSGYSVGIVQNSSTSTASLTITPAAGTINGSASLVLTAGENVSIWTDGTNYFSTSVSAGGSSTPVQNFINVPFSASPFTYTPSAGMVTVDVYCIGAGGGGGSGAIETSGTAASGGAGGGSGAGVFGRFTAAQIGSSQTVTIGAGGAGGTAPAIGAATAGGNGAAGTATTFGSLLKAFFGGGGAGGGLGIASGGGGSAGFFGGGGNGSGATGGTAGNTSGVGGTTSTASGTATVGIGGPGGGGPTTGPGSSNEAWIATGGGSGGAVTAAAAATAGGIGFPTNVGSIGTSAVAGTVASPPGNNGVPATVNLVVGGFVGGTGGSGGASSVTTTLAGGNGGIGAPGSGGGGGGSVLTTNTVAAGSGGAGGNGQCALVENF
jgi:hypothetical protein